MKLELLGLIFLGYFIEVSEEGGGGHHKHIKIIVPALIHKHTHKHTVYKKVPVHDHNKNHVVVHKHNHKHHHKHDHGHKHGHKHKHAHKHAHKHDHKHKGHHKRIKETPHYYSGGWSGANQYKPESEFSSYKSPPVIHHQKSFLDDDFLNPVEYDDDGYKTSKKSIRSEHVEIKQLNPNSIYEGDKYIVRGAYKVQEGDPYTETTTTSYETYDSPSGKILAQIITNFGGKYDELLPYKDEEDREEREKQEGDDSVHHEDVVDYDETGNSEGIQNQDYENNELVQANSGNPHQQELVLDNDSVDYADQIEKYIIRQVYGPSGGAK